MFSTVSYILCFFAVSGDANFSMEYTGLTIGGFTQANVARGFIESTANVEKGLIQRFHWLIPKPHPKKFADLNTMDKTFSDSVGEKIIFMHWFCVFTYLILMCQ